MPASDHLTVRAYHHGKRPAYFRGSAKRYANIAMVLFIVTGIVWFISGWGWAFIPFAPAVYAAVRGFIDHKIAVRLEEMENTPL